MDMEVECPACSSVMPMEENLLGVLGSRVHLRCRCCGMQWSMSVEELEGEMFS